MPHQTGIQLNKCTIQRNRTFSNQCDDVIRRGGRQQKARAGGHRTERPLIHRRRRRRNPPASSSRFSGGMVVLFLISTCTIVPTAKLSCFDSTTTPIARDLTTAPFCVGSCNEYWCMYLCIRKRFVLQKQTWREVKPRRPGVWGEPSVHWNRSRTGHTRTCCKKGGYGRVYACVYSPD